MPPPNHKTQNHTKIHAAHKPLTSKIHQPLVSKAFTTQILSHQHPLSPTTPTNITNKTPSPMGVQIHISKA
ncbi:poly-gamma-glutamate hydrolase family protein, partial [Priestia megaterium]|uniref:poly-gamma-glutamate hydrolase family protein n=1 Tax=Priestia megaterium TaxID=1404 RepID=UPI0022A7392C